MDRGLGALRMVAGLAVLLVRLGTLPAMDDAARVKEQSSTPLQPIAAPEKVLVGANVHVSKPSHTIHHTESVIAAHPTDPARLFIAAMYDRGVVGYYSENGGESWRLSFDKAQRHEPERTEILCDPAAVFAPDGSLHFVCVRYWSPDKGPQPKFGDPDVGRLEFSRSADCGKTWGPATNISTFTDRPWLAVDGTQRRYRGQLYCFATVDKPVLHVSQDQGKSFSKPLVLPIKGDVLPRPSNPVVLTDGTLALLCALDPQRRQFEPTDPRGRLPILALRSGEGGLSLEESSTVATYWSDTGYFIFPQLAADTTTEKYRDRLYAVWTDGALLNRAQRTQTRIMLSVSKDKGKSWSRPRVLSEQPEPGDGKGDKDYAAFLPSIAVNRNGVVAVSWYDRRGIWDPAKAAGFPSGWNVRLRLSSDGGETWSSSIQVNEKPGKGSCTELKETAGLAADAAGDFHPVWIDNRTGKRQVWTAPVKLKKASSK
jgi:hypothetical protein